MTWPSLVAVAHGSRDPAAQRTVEELVDAVRARRPGLDVRVAYVQNAEPALPRVLAGLTSGSTGGAVVVPLLLSRGYHVAVDITRAAAAVGAAVTPPLGPDPLLTEALAGRLAEAGVPAGAPVVLAAAGSSDPAAGVDVEAQAAALAQQRGAPVVAGYASAVPPAVGEAVGRLIAARRGTGSRPVAVATYLLAPGRFADAVQATARQGGAGWVSAPLGAHPALAGLVLERYLSAVPGAGGSGAARNLVARGG